MTDDIKNESRSWLEFTPEKQKEIRDNITADNKKLGLNTYYANPETPKGYVICRYPNNEEKVMSNEDMHKQEGDEDAIGVLKKYGY